MTESAQLELWVVVFTLVLARVSMFVVAFPLFGQRYLPHLVKLGICLTLTLAWLPQVDQSSLPVPSASWPQYALAMAAELLVGGFLGSVFGLLLVPIRIAGMYIGQEMGFSLGQITDPGSGSASTETGTAFESLGVLLLFSLDIHHAILQTLHASFALVRVDRSLLANASHFYSWALSESHDASFVLIAPLATLLFMFLFILAVLMRAWPQINLFSFGMSARIAVGLIGWFALMPGIVAQMQRFLTTASTRLPQLLLGT